MNGGHLPLSLDPPPSFVGVSRYADSHPGIREDQPRIYVRFQLEGEPSPYLALLDTGAHYCVLEQELAQRIAPQLREPIGQVVLRTARGRVQGDLYTHRLTLLAETGESVDFDATVFISQDWQGPSFLGYLGAMDRVLFAIDAQLNGFYIGHQ